MVRKNIQLHGLPPNSKYLLQIRGVDSDNHPGQWSTQYELNTVVDTMPPAAVQNLSVQSDGANFVISWDDTTTNEDGTPLDDLRDYQVAIAAGGQVVVHHTTNNSFVYVFSNNRTEFGTPQAALSVTVQARDRVGNLSIPATEQGVNGAPGAPVLMPAAKRNGVELSWDDTFDDDGLRFEIWKNGSLHVQVSPGTLTWLDTNVGDGPQSYMVRAVDMFNQSADSNTVLEQEITIDPDTDTVAPKPPTDLDAESSINTGGYSDALLSWSAPTQDEDDTSYTDQEGFEVRYRTDNSRPWTYERVPDDRADGSVPQVFNLYLSGLMPGATLNWAVRAFDRAYNYSDWAFDTHELEDDTSVPDAPSGVSAAGGIRTIVVNWQANDQSDRVTGYRVYASQTPGVTVSPSNLVYDGLGTATSFVVGESEEWHVIVVAYRTGFNDTYTSDASTEVSAQSITVADDTVPGNVSLGSLALSANAYWHGSSEYGSLSVSWPAAADAVGYIISWRPADGDWSEISVGGETRTYTITGLAPGVSHDVRMKAYSAGGILSPAWSTIRSRTVPSSTSSILPSITGLQAESGATSVTFSWNDISDDPRFDTYWLQVATNSAFTHNVRNIYIRSNEYKYTAPVGRYYGRVRSRTQFGTLGGFSSQANAYVEGVSNEDLNVLDLSEGGKYTGVLEAQRVSIGPSTSFAPDYDPTDYATEAEAEGYADAIDAAIRGDFTGTTDGTFIDGSRIQTGSIDAELLKTDIAIINGLQVESLFRVNAGGSIESDNFSSGELGDPVVNRIKDPATTSTSYWSPTTATTTQINYEDGESYVSVHRINTGGSALLFGGRDTDVIPNAQSGDVYTLMYEVRTTDGGGFYIAAWNVAGSGNTFVNSSFQTINTNGEWQQVKIVFTITDSAAFGNDLSLVFDLPVSPGGPGYDFRRVAVVKGDYDGDWFSGDSPNSHWQGTPNNSMSVYQEQGVGQGYRLGTNGLEFYGGSIVLGEDGLNINTESDQLWFGHETFANASWRVDADGTMRSGDDNGFYAQDGNIWSGGTSPATAPWTISAGGQARFDNVRITGDNAPDGTNIISAGDSFVVTKVNSSYYTLNLAGDLSVDAGGSLAINGGNLSLTQGSINMYGGGLLNMYGGIMNLAGGNLNLSGANLNAYGSDIVVMGSNAGQTSPTPGIIRSNNYNYTNKTGWALDNGNLYLFGGEISAAAINMDQGTNLLEEGWTSFEYGPEWYAERWSTSPAATTASVSQLWSRYGSSALRLQGNSSGTVRFGLGTTGKTLDVEPSTAYTLSMYLYNNASGNRSFRTQVRWSNGTLSTGPTLSVGAGQTVRYVHNMTSSSAHYNAQIRLMSMTTGSDFFIDGVQFEEAVDGRTDPTFFKPSGVTTISGQQITTGSIKSSSLFNGMPAWELDTNGVAVLSGALVKNFLLVQERGIIQSVNYNGATGPDGMINMDGTKPTQGWAMDASGQLDAVGGRFSGLVEGGEVTQSGIYNTETGPVPISTTMKDGYIGFSDRGTINPMGDYLDPFASPAGVGMFARDTDSILSPVISGVAAHKTGSVAITGQVVMSTPNARLTMGSLTDRWEVHVGRGATPLDNDTLFLSSGTTLSVWHYRFHQDYFSPDRGDNSKSLGTAGARWTTVYATNGTINTSDEETKTDIRTTQLGLDFINRLDPISYKAIDSTFGRTHHGFGANQVADALQDLGVDTTDFGGYIDPVIGEDAEVGPKGLRYSEFIAPIVRAIQEQQELIEQLQQKIDTLTS